MINDARATLGGLEAAGAESHPTTTSTREHTPQLGLFSPPAPSPVAEAMRALDPDSMSPREALDALYRLKKML